nr:NADH deshydrogenase subunit 6 [Xorides funiuensis]
MNKSLIFILYSFYPFITYMIMLIIMTLPSKNMKFHPLMLMMLLILYTLMMSNKMNLFYKSWIPFITFLIMIGGLMIIFLYIISLANNELLSLNKNILIKFLFKFIIMIFMLFIMFNNNYMMKWYENINIIENSNFTKSSNINMNFMYENINNWMSMFIMIYLYYSMICIMNLCYKFKSPLRQLSFYV